MSDMIITLRQFHRELARIRQAASQGTEIIVQARGGARYLFKRIDAHAPLFGDIAGHLAGSTRTGRRTKDLSGYGRNPK